MTPTPSPIQREALNRPRDRAELFGWVQCVLGVDVPHAPVCDHHAGPLDYLEHVFFERPGDALVWANRGGGKTYYGAVATMLDMLFKPGISVRILGGSMQQSQRMYEHLRKMLERPGLRGLLCGRMGQGRLRLINGSEVELLSQSQTSVRGCRVQKLRCDEVDEFEDPVWSAAQFVTQGRRCGQTAVRGTIEAMSTMHYRTGLMRRLVDEARGVGRDDEPTPTRRPTTGRRLMEWCVLDVMARCDPAHHDCNECPLATPCGGRARRFMGFHGVADVLAQRQRTGRDIFDVEMLCLSHTPRADRVYVQFDPAVHVRPLALDPGMQWVCGMDPGYAGSTVVLWAQVRLSGRRDYTVHVLDELRTQGLFIPQITPLMADKPWPVPQWLGVDPAGRANSVNGLNAVDQLRDAGYNVRTLSTRIGQGVDLIRQLLRPAQGPPRLLIDPRCKHLVRAMAEYHYDDRNPNDTNPVKDGHDHAADALRYMLVNLFNGGDVEVAGY